jgi:hypothetical protein
VAHRKGSTPGAAAAATEAQGYASGKRSPCSLPNESSQALAYTITDGRDAVGTVERHDGYFVAIDTDGHTIGRYHDLKIAVRALPDGRRA